MQYRKIPKQAVLCVMQDRRARLLRGNSTVTPRPSFWQPAKWPEWWQKGAEELEKTTPGKVITAPVRLPEAVLTSTRKTVEQVPGVLKTVTKAVPLLALSAAVVGAGYLVYKGTKGKKDAGASA